jgi:oxygen tolerance protein BatD
VRGILRNRCPADWQLCAAEAVESDGTATASIGIPPQPLGPLLSLEGGRGRRHPSLVLRLLLLAFAWLAAAGAARADIQVRATLEPAVIGVGETATLTIEVHGGLSALHFQPGFELENFEVAGGPFQYEDLRIENGSFSRSLRMSWQLRPLAAGPARVRALGLRLRGQVVRLQDHEVRVQEEPTEQVASSPADQGGEDPFEQLFGHGLPWRRAERPEQPSSFLRAEAQPQRPVVGQQVVYSVYLYTREEIKAATPRELPTFRGFWVRDIAQPQHLPTFMVDVGGVRYGRIALVQKALFPLQPGRHAIEPAAVDLLSEVVERGFFGPAFTRPQQLSLRTESQVVDVQPLPPAPPGFGGAVGRLALAAGLEPRQVRLGEASTLTVSLAGQGNLQGAAPPQLAVPAGLTVFPPQQQGNEQVAGTVVQGRRTWSFVVVPNRAGRYVLQAPAVTYFDPEAKQYRAATAPPVELTALDRPAAAGRDAGGATLAPEGSSGRGGSLLLPWLFALPFGVALVVVLVRRRHLAEAQSGADAGPAPGKRSCWRRLESRLAATASETRPRQTAAAIEEAWREFLAERWEIPPGTPSTRWRDLLVAHGADAGSARELVGLADDLHYLRYAPQLSATDGLCAEALARSRRLLRRLR